MRTATVFSPEVTKSEILSDFGNNNVSGPGQKALANFCAFSGKSAIKEVSLDKESV